MTTPSTPNDTTTYRIFISHSSKDDDFGIKLAEDLSFVLQDNEAVWYDHLPENGLTGGTKWQPEIEKKVRECPIFIVILTSDSLDSRWVKFETEIALRQRKPKKHIIPLLYRQCTGDLRVSLEERQFIFFHPADPGKIYEQAFSELLLALRPAIKMGVGEIERVLKDSNRVLAQGMIPPDIKADIDAGNFDLAIEKLHKLIYFYQREEQWNYVIHYCDATMKLAPDDITIQKALGDLKSKTSSKIEIEKQTKPDHTVSRNIYNPHYRMYEVDHSSLRTQRSSAKTTTEKSTNQRNNKSVLKAEAAISTTPKRQLPKMRTTTDLDLIGELGATAQATVKFMRNNLSTREIDICSKGFLGPLFLLFFLVDVVGAFFGFINWFHTPSIFASIVLAAILALMFLWGIINTNNFIGIVLTGVFWLVWCAVGYQYIRSPFAVICSIALACACLRLQLFKKHSKRGRTRRRG
jgi:hypothetical protein